MLGQQRRRMCPALEPRRDAKTEPAPHPDERPTDPCETIGDAGVMTHWAGLISEAGGPGNAARIVEQHGQSVAVLAFYGALRDALRKAGVHL